MRLPPYLYPHLSPQRDKKWQASAHVGLPKAKYLGQFNNEEDAYQAVLEVGQLPPSHTSLFLSLASRLAEIVDDGTSISV